MRAYVGKSIGGVFIGWGFIFPRILLRLFGLVIVLLFLLAVFG